MPEMTEKNDWEAALAAYDKSRCHPQYDHLDGSIMRCGQDEPVERCREHCDVRLEMGSSGPK